MRLTRGCRAGGGVACSSLEYGGIRAAKRPRLRPLPTATPDVASSATLFSPLRSSPFSTLLSLSYYYTPPGTPARSCYSLLLLPRILCRLYADNSDDDDVPISLRRHCQLAVRLAKR